MFVDEAAVLVKSGNGGNGAVAFRREKGEPKGGPSGGDGGRGGNVIFIVDPGMKTLMDFRHQRRFFARNGGNGASKNMTGKDGEDLVVKVPAGTIIKGEKEQVIVDLTAASEQAIIARGGKGGQGNARFATATNRAPKFAQQGVQTKESTVNLELKLLADVAIIGLPNVGKSTLINRMSTAKAKVGDYPFTTKAPNLGMVRLSDDREFIVADIPGLIEDAHLGKGMGIEFLKHVERATLLVHLVDLSHDGEDRIMKDYKLIKNELGAYSRELATRPEIVVGNKIDLPDARGKAGKVADELAAAGIEFMTVSAVTGEGVDGLIYALADEIDTISKDNKP